jgi:hypothetical protein
LVPINDRITPPASVADAVDRKDIGLILESWDSEMTSLGKFKAITHNHTRADLIKMGISTPPIPTRMLSDVKYKDGKSEKYKGRMIALGFRMIKGVHFDGKTFSPTPNQHTNKILMALVAGEDLDMLSFDISLACTWGERGPENYPGGTKIALSYRPGLRRWNADGEQLYIVSHRSHYGLGPAGRTWFNTRQTKLLKMFNAKHWQSLNRRQKSGFRACCASQKASLKILASMRTLKASANTVITTENLRQGRLMADHGGLYSNAKLRQMGAKEGQGGTRARCFSYCKWGKEKGDCGNRVVCSLVALGSLVRGSRGHSGAVCCSSFLGEEERQDNSSLP